MVFQILADYLQGRRSLIPLTGVYRYCKHLDTAFDSWNGWGRYKKVEGGSTLGFPRGEANLGFQVSILGSEGVRVEIQMVLGSTFH